MKVYLLAFYMLTGILVLSCNSDQKQNSAAFVTQDVAVESEVKEQATNNKREHTDTTTVAPPQTDVLQTGNPQPDWDKKIIKTANITLELDDYKIYNSLLHGSIKKFGAYIASEEQAQTDERIENAVTIKVPVAQFENLVNTFSGNGIKIVSKRIASEDVTAEVVDTKARIDAKKQVRARYLELLKQAKNMEEILQVQNEINDIQVDLETADGRVKYLVNQAAYSTVHLVYYQYINGATGYNRQPGFFTSLKEAFYNGGKLVSMFFIFLVAIWPVLLVGFLGWMLFRRYRANSVSAVKKV